ncbi:metal-dependent hydrolase [Halorubrum ezzemoulense]|uniref:Metal-dependent hydrolase n=1 Tax=Halorubrum ezzemoulense TaxID=337243 RepID=A0A256JFA3_HALEZ|nr:SprT family zinc-dependent metalloprotease [Halorubrum ezzemoulense]OYR67538.1 metal-dependent hydrolase [Halorubrum ezzemoulense]
MAKSQPSDLRTIDLLGNDVEFEVRRSSEATKPRIDVDIHGVAVIIPNSVDVQPTEVLRENAAWVVEKQRDFERYREKIPDWTFEAGEMFPLLGTERELLIEPARSHSITDTSIRLRKSTVEQSTVKQVLENVYRREARDHFTERADFYAEEMGVEYGKITIRNQRTRWGSCSTTGTISLNWRLVMAPPEVVDYVVVHELAHLREANHDDRFWSIVAEYDPEYESHAQWLEEHSTELIFSEEDL